MKALGEFERAVLLAVLHLEDQAYGVSIRRELEKALRRSVSFGAVYTTLDRLVAKGLLSTWSGDPTPQRGGRAKKYFSIEPAGRKALAHARKTSEAIWRLDPVAGGR